jgi:hypothetical protein
VTVSRQLAIPVLAAALALPAAAADGASKARPKAFASCTAVGDYARKQALRIVGPGGLPFRFGFAVATPEPAPGPPRGPVNDESGTPGPQPVSGPPAGDGIDYSGTNVQEAGIDEPDFVKTDGSHLYAITGSTLYVFDVRSGEPKLTGSLALKGYGHELLVSGDRVLALTTYYNDPVLQPQPEPQPPSEQPKSEPQPDQPQAGVASSPGYFYGEPATRLFEIDVSDKAAPKLLNTLTVEGFYVSARLRESVARVVVSTPPSPWAIPSDEPMTEEEAERRHKRAIRRTRVSTWLPDGVLRDRVRRKRRMQRMVACDDVRKPAAFSGPGMLTVLTVDLDKGLKPLDSDSLMTDAQTIYASKRSLFVATERWFDPTQGDPERLVDPGRFTSIHRFGIADPASAEYRASGQLRGFVLNQFSLSEHDGVLRVATTDQPPWREGAEQRESESFVTVLDESEGVLRPVGQVGGLGKGERIFAVRFMEDVGYVVTFRQVDPLYTVDLSDPRNPAVRGELKIPGFSSYLHPIDGDLLLGLGQDADEDGRTRGTQLSLFDVSDLSAPKRIHQQTLGENTSSEAEHDHHAFLYWPPTKLSVVPLSQYKSEEDQFNGAAGFEIDRSKGITEVGRVEHDAGDYPYQGTIRRSLVARGRLFTVSDRGVVASTLDTLAPVAFAPFPSAGG